MLNVEQHRPKKLHHETRHLAKVSFTATGAGPNCERRCDFNYDGVVNNIDALALLANNGTSCEIPRSGL